MTEPVERAQSDDKWEQPGPAPQEQSAMGALAELIEVAASPDRMSDRATMSGVAAVMPTIPPGARRPPDLLLIETMPPGEYEEARQQEVMPSNLPMPSWSLLPSATAVPAAPAVPTALVIPPPLAMPAAPAAPIATAVTAPAAASPAAGITMATIEGLVSQNQWGKVCTLLGAPENQGRLPVGMAFIYAVALNELRVPGGLVDKRAPDIEKIMLRCLGVMLGADPKGPLAQIIAKRLMRRSWRATPAPPTRTSVLLIIAALMVGSFIGFLIGPGHDWFKNM